MPNTQATAPGTRDHEGQSLSPILEVRDLEVEFAVDDGKIKVLDGVSFQVAPGKTLGIVGESGCGKSVTSLAIMGLLPRPRSGGGGLHPLSGEELLNLPPEQMYKVRGNRISMIFQEPMTALNPVQTVGDQLMEVFRLHRPDYSKAQRRDAAIAMLKGGDPRACPAFRGLSPQSLRRHAPAGDDRHGAGLRTGPAHLRRADHGARCDHQAQILDLMKELQAQTGIAHHLHHPRSRGGGGAVRRGGGDVCRACGGAGRYL
jgi:peptide/nickel transport system ATP-binding protein